ncbi:MAG: helix-turn-helix domain-containing protein [Gemmataceae bacterium]
MRPQPPIPDPPDTPSPQRDAWIDLPENRAAMLAVRRAHPLRGKDVPGNPLFLHGPAGSGKSRLLGDLMREQSRPGSSTIVAWFPAGDLGRDTEDLPDWKQADLILVEDLQHLRPGACELLVSLVDHAVARRRRVILTANRGPALLGLPARLTSRLAQGLVVALETLSPESRRAFLRQRQPEWPPEMLDFLARTTPGSIRQLEGALHRVETMRRSLGRFPSTEELQTLLTSEGVEGLTLEQILRKVGSHFRVESRDLQGRGQSRAVLLPRQVGMYLARKLTPCSLDGIGAYFGGRDHSTVLHACRKVESALEKDEALRGTIRDLQAQLG